MIPCIDLAPSFSPQGREGVAAQIRQACETIGFFTIIGHGVPDSVVADLQAEARAFSALPEAEKLRVPQPSSRNSRGYMPPKQRALGYTLGAKTPPDWQEGYGSVAHHETPAHIE